MELYAVSLLPAALNEGVWIDSPRGWPGVGYRVRSFNFAPYARARELLYARLRREAGKKPIDPILRDREVGRLIAEHLLIDWRGLTQEGKVLPLTEALGVEILTEVERAPLSEDILAAIGEAGEAQAEAESDLEKKLTDWLQWSLTVQPVAKLLASAAAQDPRAESALEASEPPPDLDPAAGLFLSAWGDLQYDRDFTNVGAPLPIRWQTIQVWSQTHRLTLDEAAMLARILRAMDATYCQILNARAEADLKEPST